MKSKTTLEPNDVSQIVATIAETEALATGLTLDELRSRSLLKILQNRRQK